MGKLRTTGEWTPELLEEYYQEIDTIAKEDLKLSTYTNQLEIISSEQMLEAYSTHAMPVMYSHWRFGKDYVNNKNAYEKGRMNLAYEVVINSSPCIAYLMEENSIMMQALVTAHASFGHNSFFKNNYLFRNWTDASFIVDYLSFAKKYVALCEEKYGIDEVEEFLDSCHSLELYGVDKYRRSRGASSMEKEANKLKNLIFDEENYDDVLNQTIPKKKKSNLKKVDMFSHLEDIEPEENVLYFLEKNTPYLETWQQELLRIVRKVSQYFYPQRQTKLMNEGWATYIHYKIMNRLYDKGLVDDGFMMEFFESHTAVTAQPGYDHPYYRMMGINVYSLGFRMFQDIERICMEPTDEDREWFPDFAGNGKWLETVTWAMENFRDESFVLQFLSPKVIRDYKMFKFEDLTESDVVTITDIHNNLGYANIRQELARMFDISELLPNLQVTKVDPADRALYISHYSDEQYPLDEKQTTAVLKHIKNIWKFDVYIQSKTTNGEIYQEF